MPRDDISVKVMTCCLMTFNSHYLNQYWLIVDYTSINLFQWNLIDNSMLQGLCQGKCTECLFVPNAWKHTPMRRLTWLQVSSSALPQEVGILQAQCPGSWCPGDFCYLSNSRNATIHCPIAMPHNQCQSTGPLSTATHRCRNNGISCIAFPWRNSVKSICIREHSGHHNPAGLH